VDVAARRFIVTSELSDVMHRQMQRRNLPIVHLERCVTAMRSTLAVAQGLEEYARLIDPAVPKNENAG
jgi:hypothetical protein